LLNYSQEAKSYLSLHYIVNLILYIA